MPAKKRTADPGAPIPLPQRKVFEVGAWFMPEDPIFVQQHIVAQPRSKDKIITVCRLELRPDFSGRTPGIKCKICTRIASEAKA